MGAQHTVVIGDKGGDVLLTWLREVLASSTKEPEVGITIEDANGSRSSVQVTIRCDALVPIAGLQTRPISV